jgi:HTH-type transcriptional regulator / antitoxin HigA
MPCTQNSAGKTGNTPLTTSEYLAMETLLYKIIKTDTQYKKYCDRVEALVQSGKTTKAVLEEIELLNLLIDKYDTEHQALMDADPVELLKALMKDHKMKAVDLAKWLNVSEGLVSDILRYKKGFSKETIRLLAEKFKLSQEAFNRPYALHTFGKANIAGVKKSKAVQRRSASLY